MPEFFSISFYGLIGLPMLLLPFFFLANGKNRTRLLLMLLISLTIMLLSLFFAGELIIKTPLQFLNQSIYFSLSKSNLIFSLATLAAAWLFIIPTRESLLLSRRDTLLFALALSIAFIAFFSGQFMQRYLALEWIGLIIAILPLTSFSDKRLFKRTADIFIILRIGDLLLLSAILIMYAQTGTLDIDAMLAATAAGIPYQPWVMTCLLLAIFVKIAVYPFGLWLQNAGNSSDGLIFWVPSILMPALGLYLLYRILPIIQSDPIIPYALLIYIILLIGIKFLTKQQRALRPAFLNLLNVVIFIAATFLPKQYFPFAAFFYILLRAVSFVFLSKTLDTISKPVKASLSTGMNMGSFAVQIFDEHYLFRQICAAGQKFANFLHQVIETQVFAGGVSRFADLFGNVTGKLHRLETEIITNGILNLAANFERIAIWLREKVEDGFENIWAYFGIKLFNLSSSTLSKLEEGGDALAQATLQKTLTSIEQQDIRAETKPIRLDLLWVPLFMILIMIFLFLAERG